MTSLADSKEEFWTVQEVADMLKLSPQTVRNRIHAGEWDCNAYGARTYRFTRDQLEAIIPGKPVAPKPTKKHRQRIKDALRNMT